RPHHASRRRTGGNAVAVDAGFWAGDAVRRPLEQGQGRPISLVTRGDAKIDYRRHARARERYNQFSRHLPSLWHSRLMTLLPSLAQIPTLEGCHARWKSLGF